MGELSIRLRIGNREYPMRVRVEEEELIKKAGKLLNEKIKSYQEQFGLEDQQDLLAMVSFDFLIEKMKVETKVREESLMAADKIRQLNAQISQML